MLEISNESLGCTITVERLEHMFILFIIYTSTLFLLLPSCNTLNIERDIHTTQNQQQDIIRSGINQMRQLIEHAQ